MAQNTPVECTHCMKLTALPPATFTPLHWCAWPSPRQQQAFPGCHLQLEAWLRMCCARLWAGSRAPLACCAIVPSSPWQAPLPVLSDSGMPELQGAIRAWQPMAGGEHVLGVPGGCASASLFRAVWELLPGVGFKASCGAGCRLHCLCWLSSASAPLSFVSPLNPCLLAFTGHWLRPSSVPGPHKALWVAWDGFVFPVLSHGYSVIWIEWTQVATVERVLNDLFLRVKAGPPKPVPECRWQCVLTIRRRGCSCGAVCCLYWDWGRIARACGWSTCISEMKGIFKWVPPMVLCSV